MALFSKILIANRGEIACRIIKTLQKLGIQSVAVYSEADKGALHAEMADEAYEIGPAAAKNSYLNIEKIISIAQKTGAEAVHPGFGFLAENPLFADALLKENIMFIGPSAECLRQLGDKIEAKRIAHKLGIPILSGDLGPVLDTEAAVLQAQKLGYPVLIKAVAGGGGKGMRRAYSDEELREGVERAMSEASSSFNDPRVFIEKFLEKPRHIEIQILADQHGNYVYLGERECSLQRRYQKIIEEAPSPFVDPLLRQKLGQDALKIAKAVQYVSVGTVEFLVDQNKNYYFLEVNPRLQVEHPVTEMVTGIDLVEQMIRVVSGEELSFTQKDIELKGWSIEARICAENPEHHFMPSIGRIKRFWYEQKETIRVDKGVEEGAEITPFYDSMIAKAISYGETRQEAIENLSESLESFVILGLEHNISFLGSLLEHPHFKEGNFSTRLIENDYKEGFAFIEPDKDLQKLFIRCAAFFKHLEESHYRQTQNKVSEWQVKTNDCSCNVKVFAMSPYIADVWLENEGVQSITLKYHSLLSLIELRAIDATYWLHVHAKEFDLKLIWRFYEFQCHILPLHMANLLRFIPEKEQKEDSKFVVSPMPGLLLSLSVSEGDFVKSGEPLAVIEAMKMENIVRAHREGKIVKLHVSPGESLKAAQPIIEFESVA